MPLVTELGNIFSPRFYKVAAPDGAEAAIAGSFLDNHGLRDQTETGGGAKKLRQERLLCRTRNQ
jgi:hypothetical protein